MLIAVAAMFLQQTCGSIARALPAVLAPLIIAELHADAAWVGVYTSLRELSGTDPQGEVRYRGCGPIEAKPGRHAEGELGVMFSIVYVSIHEEL